MQITINKEHIKEIRNFIKNEDFVIYLNEKGLSINAMALMLQIIFDGIDTTEKELEDINE